MYHLRARITACNLARIDLASLRKRTTSKSSQNLNSSLAKPAASSRRSSACLRARDNASQIFSFSSFPQILNKDQGQGCMAASQASQGRSLEANFLSQRCTIRAVCVGRVILHKSTYLVQQIVGSCSCKQLKIRRAVTPPRADSGSPSKRVKRSAIKCAKRSRGTFVNDPLAWALWLNIPLV